MANQCPAGCTVCGGTFEIESQGVCMGSGDVTGTACDFNHENCPLGSFCRQNSITCSVPCAV
jgi:hypothetical protein